MTFYNDFPAPTVTKTDRSHDFPLPMFTLNIIKYFGILSFNDLFLGYTFIIPSSTNNLILIFCFYKSLATNKYNKFLD